MRYIVILLVVVAAFLLFRVCTRAVDSSKNFITDIKKELNISDVLGAEGCGNVAEKKVEVKPFTKLKVSRSLLVILKQAEPSGVTIVADESLHPYFKVENNGNTLVVSLKENIQKGKAEVHVSYEDLKYLKACSGSTVKSNEQKHQFSSLHIDVSSGANVKLPNIETHKVECDVTTGANLFLSGMVKDLEVNVSTGGNANLYKLIAENCQAKATTGGNAKIYVKEKLNATASTAGSIKYKGNPKDVDKKVNTGGDIDARH